ncbi:hypothetical protein JTB14_008662 [Gonioctena quinquepunctata]|nr:hypothetical protein JTB14_008662 [Gonioctena quinquepunctata]
MPPQKKLKTSNQTISSTNVRNFRQFAGHGDVIEGNVNSEISRNQENTAVESAPESCLIKHEMEDHDYGNGAGTSNCMMITAEELSSIVKDEDIVEEDIPLESYDTSTDDWSISQAEVNAIVKKKGCSEGEPDNYTDYQDISNSGDDECDFSQSVVNSS